MKPSCLFCQPIRQPSPLYSAPPGLACPSCPSPGLSCAKSIRATVSLYRPDNWSGACLGWQSGLSVHIRSLFLSFSCGLRKKAYMPIDANHISTPKDR